MATSETAQVRPRAWLRVSNISGQSSGVFETQDVELRSESLVPLYDQPALNVAAADERQAAWDALRFWLERGAKEYASGAGMSIAESIHGASAIRVVLAQMAKIEGPTV